MAAAYVTSEKRRHSQMMTTPKVMGKIDFKIAKILLRILPLAVVFQQN